MLISGGLQEIQKVQIEQIKKYCNQSNNLKQSRSSRSSQSNNSTIRTSYLINSHRMKQQDQCIAQQSDSQQSVDLQQESNSSISSDDQVKQKTAFYILDQETLIHTKHKQTPSNQRQQDLNQSCSSNQPLDQDEKQAFLYLLYVRKEKKTLLQEKKKRKSQFKKKVQKITVEFTQKKLHNIINDELIEGNQTKQNNLRQVQFDTWKEDNLKKEDECCECILNNFNIVVENVKYLIKTTPSYSHNNKKFNTKLYQSITLQNKPALYELIKLTIGQIQNAIRKLSLELQFGPKNKSHPQPISIPQSNQEKTSLIKYSLWIYSLLALHQAWSAYKHFETLAEINFVLTQNIKLSHKISVEQKKSLLIIFTLITKVFEQRHLEKLTHQILLPTYDSKTNEGQKSKIG